MHLFGFSVNMLTLFGLVLAIAIVVDDAIVVVENSTRLLDTGKYSSKEAVEQAMGEITGPVVGVVLVLMAVFIPTAFVGGITGELYKQFALTIAAATFFSGFNSLTLTPALCALFLRPSSGKKFIFYRNFNKVYDRLVSVYVSVITRSIRRPIFTTFAFDGCHCSFFTLAYLFYSRRRSGVFYCFGAASAGFGVTAYRRGYCPCRQVIG